MKKILFILGLVLPLAFSCNNAEKKETGNEQKAAVKVNPDNVVILELDVEGMTCTGCENTINEGVSELPGVVDVRSFHVDGKAYVEYDSALTTEKDISRMIEQRGYKVTSFRKAQRDELMLEEKE